MLAGVVAGYLSHIPHNVSTLKLIQVQYMALACDLSVLTLTKTSVDFPGRLSLKFWDMKKKMVSALRRLHSYTVHCCSLTPEGLMTAARSSCSRVVTHKVEVIQPSGHHSYSGVRPRCQT